MKSLLLLALVGAALVGCSDPGTVSEQDAKNFSKSAPADQNQDDPR